MDNNRQIKFRLVLNGKIEGYEKLTETGWKWMWLELNPDVGERWTNGVVESANGIIRDRFTGLTDKEGNEVYEGDLLTRELGVKWRVQFTERGWRAVSLNLSGLYLDPEQFVECKIVGTIHQ